MVSSSGAGEGAVARLARRLGDGEFCAPSAALADAAARRVFDTLGALAIGQRVARVPASGRFESDMLGRIRRLCAVIRCSEIDDIDPLGLVTPGAIVVPVALLLAQESGADGEALLASVIAGYEVMVALGEGLDGARLLARGVWPTYLLAPAATAAAAASLWGFDEQRMTDALAIALARAAGVAGRPPREPTSRWWLCGAAAADGVLAADAAALGLAGDPALLERGLGPDQTIGFDSARQREGEPIRLTVTETKPLCTARQALPAVEAALAIRPRLAGRPVESIEVAVPEAYRAMVDRPAAADRISTIQSVQFQVAAALSEDPVLLDPIRAQPRLGESGRQLMSCTSVVADAELSTRYPAVWSARVTARLAGGEELTESSLEIPGTRSPAGWEELAAKYSRAGMDGPKINSLLDACKALPSAGRGGVEAVMDGAGHEGL